MHPLENILRSSLDGIQPYNSGLSLHEIQSRYDVTNIAKLASNENPYGPAPQVQDYLDSNKPDLFLYPDSGSNELRSTLAKYLSVPEDILIFGNGSEELISIICRSVIEPGDRVITLYPSFPLHEDYAAMMGGKIERISVNDQLEIDVPALIDAASKPAKMLIFANPMNPVGCWLNPEQLRQVVRAKHPDTLLVLDEAYYEYAISGDYESGKQLLDENGGNWILLRTFSKAWGLAGLRVGFGICSSPELRRALDLSRTPFNINAIAQAAASQALRNEGHMTKFVKQIITAREHVSKELVARGYNVAPSLGNFLFFQVCGSSSELAERLLSRGTIVKPWKQEKFDDFIRVSIGTDVENAKFLEDLQHC